MSSAIDSFPWGYVHRLTGRFVMVCDPDGEHLVLRTPFLARERSVRELRGIPVTHECELANGVRFQVPPSWVSDCPDNVLPYWCAP